MHKTKIIATVGPACQTDASLAALVREGVDVLRINASHCGAETLPRWVNLIRGVSKTVRKKIVILVDLQGPRVRTGSLPSPGFLELKTKSSVLIRPGVSKSDGFFIGTPVVELRKMVKPGDKILIDNGIIELKVKRFQKEAIDCEVLIGGQLGENKGINLPNAPVTLPPLTEKDDKDLKTALRLGVDCLALSFVRSRRDIDAIKRKIKSFRKKVPVIAKIEKPLAVRNIDGILEVADGVMVARGDLGIEMGIEKVPGVQKLLVKKANEHGVPAIVATHLLETMIEKPHPTRAEVSDIANAVFEGADAVLLTGETAVGKYPLRVIRIMKKIITEAESFKRKLSR